MASYSVSALHWQSAGYFLSQFDATRTYQFCAEREITALRGEKQTTRLVIAAPALSLDKLYKVLVGLGLEASRCVWHPSAFNAQTQTQAAIVYLPQDLNLDPSTVTQTAQAHRAEIALVSQGPRITQPGLLVMDMDSTMIACECIDDIAALAGVGPQVSEVTELAMQGKLDFAQSLRQRVACLQGAPQSILETVRDALPIMPGMMVLLNSLKQANWKVALASGGFTYFADHLRERLELDAAEANVLGIEDGKLTGEVIGRIVDANVKAQTVTSLAAQFSIPMAQTVAMGDGANDLTMMGVAGLGVAFHAKPVVQEKAAASIRFNSLDTLLHYLV